MTLNLSLLKNGLIPSLMRKILVLTILLSNKKCTIRYNSLFHQFLLNVELFMNNIKMPFFTKQEKLETKSKRINIKDIFYEIYSIIISSTDPSFD